MIKLKDNRIVAATVELGGTQKGGLFFEPTILTNLTDDMICMLEALNKAA